MENNALQVDYSNWEAGKQFPEWMDEISLSTISKGYLLPGEDVRKAYRRVAKAAAFRLKKPELENKFFKIMLLYPILGHLYYNLLLYLQRNQYVVFLLINGQTISFFLQHLHLYHLLWVDNLNHPFLHLLYV